jgi:hypothetical protein
MVADPNYLRKLMLDRGMPPHVAEGFLMNFRDESGFNPGINEISPMVPGSRGGFGLYQVTGPRRRAYESFASERGLPLDSPEAQIDFMMTELQGPESGAARSIFAAQDPNQAAVAIARDFLRPAPENLQRRVASYGGGGGSGSASSGSNSGGGTMPMGLFDMQEQPPQTFGERLRAGMRSGSLIDSLALAANSLRDRPDQNIAQIVQGRQERRDEKATANRTAAWLASQGREDLAQAMLAGGLDPRAAVAEFYKPVADTRLQDLQIEKAQIELDQLQSGINKDPDVQSSQPLPDQSGVVITLRDGSVQVKTVGGETLRGQAAVDYVRQSQDRSAEYQRSIYGARREGTLGADVVLGQEAAAAGARGTEIGQAQGAAIAGAPVDLATADTTLQYIGEIRNHPGLDIGTGLTSIANIVPGTPGYDFQNRLNQLLSGGFLTAIDQLRGMGALSNTEGQTATRAISRMDSATSKEEFLAALNDYETVVSAGRSRAATRMEGQQSPQGGAQQGGAPVTPPAPTGGGGTRLKFNPATGEFE